ncbi:ubiquitin carboxyl-terminal hydrolase 15 [Olea europaea subsp. europaea]|uniref:ubiquitinyl hydrolase 1 n=1 Tax=Olea europaea subsp. europaea TaxID=158383 RepID=A0A8S0RSK9_OLEEU|nr:ubiquitin carboxyl-terminal hydrolase 15 [Olea europaea subsp. europaea]
MIEPRETDIPVLLLVLVVLPLVTYFLLGKWNEAAKNKERISSIAQRAVEEALVVEDMAAASFIPLMPLPNIGSNQCARCYGPAKTRCSGCKSARYCSGRCQIIHWRQVHKLECQQLGNSCSSSSPKSAMSEEFTGKALLDETIDLKLFECRQQPMLENTSSDNVIKHRLSIPASTTTDLITNASVLPIINRRSVDRGTSLKSYNDVSREADGTILECHNPVSSNDVICSTLYNSPKKKASTRHEQRADTVLTENHDNIFGLLKDTCAHSECAVQESVIKEMQSHHPFEYGYNCSCSNSSTACSNRTNSRDTQVNLIDAENLTRKGITSNDVALGLNHSSERTSMKRSSKCRNILHAQGIKLHKSPKSGAKTSREQSCLNLDIKVARIKDNGPLLGSNGGASLGITRVVGLAKSSRPEQQEHMEENVERCKKVKMLFPYEEFVRCYHFEVLNLSPRGLVNCGNSCYANAVLQCLVCTKPLTVYLLRRSHSRTCCARDWCLLCELEQHVMMLRESGGPLSPGRILVHIRSISCQLGDGSQEDAHEFLRLLVTSMQSICLVGVEGENMVDSRLQDTIFIQHTFGGRLMSKVKCLRCHHESVRYENIMDLSLEIFGWVESLEDALTQFTSPEDLDGENMYRCGRCAAYVLARKQLRIQEAPNILTIILKRFQVGNYGKINKCITFPEMLDMIPFMTGTDDIPPLYMLYGVVVHLDTLNASFSGHYISYVKDLQGNWFRIDDAEVQPAEMTQVMTEGAYILFYMRSSPRPTKACTRKTTRYRTPGIQKHWPSKPQKSSVQERSEVSNNFVCSEPSLVWRSDPNCGGILRSENRNGGAPTSSDCSLFTSSDDACFTTESTRDSFSTVDNFDASNVDPISSIFNSLYSSQRSVSCSMFPRSKPETRFVSERRGYVLDSHLPNRRDEGGNHGSVTCGAHVNYGKRKGPQTCSLHCKI